MASGVRPKVFFVNQPVSLEKRYSSQSKFANHTAPLTLCHLASLTRKAGYPTSLLDAAALGLSVQETIARIAEESPRYLCLNASTVTIDEAASLAAAAKDKVKGLVVLIGGVHLTFQPERTMERYPAFDIGVVGEGDITLIELLEHHRSGRDISGLRGIIFRDGSSLVRTGKREQLQELDTLPMLAFDLLEGFPDIYRPPFFGFTTLPHATLFVSRGCPSQCLFCSSGIFGHTNVRVHSPHYVVELMRHLKERYGITQVLFYDDNFGTFRGHVRELCERLIAAGLGMTWSCNTRVTDVTPELLALMRRAGCWQISFGIESGSQRILDAMRKGTTIEGIRTALRWTREAGIRTNGYFILGFPGETEEELEETIRLATSSGLDIFQCTLFTPFPTLSFPHDFEGLGTLVDADWGDMNIFNPVFVGKGLSPEKLERYKRKAWREFYLNPRVQWNILRMALRNKVMLGQYAKTFINFVGFAILPRGDFRRKEEKRGRGRAC